MRELPLATPPLRVGRCSDYAVKMQSWTQTLKTSFPAAKVAWVGLANDWDNRTR